VHELRGTVAEAAKAKAKVKTKTKTKVDLPTLSISSISRTHSQNSTPTSDDTDLLLPDSSDPESELAVMGMIQNSRKLPLSCMKWPY
jgi:hypothetical protein